MIDYPDACDLFDLQREPVREIYSEFQALLAELMAPAVAGLEFATSGELARALTFSMRGFKDTAADVADMRRLIALQVSVIVRSLAGQPSKRHAGARPLDPSLAYQRTSPSPAIRQAPQSSLRRRASPR